MSVAAALRTVCDRAHALNLDGLSDTEIEAELSEVRRVQAQLQAYEARLCSRYDASKAWARRGALSPAAYVATTHRLPIEACRRPFRVARHLRELPAVIEALGAGRIEEPHVRRIVGADTARTHHRLVADQVTIVRWAMELPWPEFVSKLQEWLDEADPDGPEPALAVRRVDCSRTIDDRWVLDGFLDPVAGSIFARELSRLERQLFETDWKDAADRLGRDPLAHELTRTSPQRRADALVLMAERSATLPEDGRRGRPLFVVLTGHERFARMCELTNGMQVRPGQLVPYLDEALIETIVFDGPFHAIKASNQRTFRGALRRAVLAMHPRCSHPYCDEPIDRAQVDHRQPFSADGPTSQENGDNRCPRHNRQKGARVSADDQDDP